MQTSYMEYAMSVIISRALPDVRDGLKPVQRRILYAMQRAGATSGSRYRKCAAFVGDVLKLYHPHGDTAGFRRAVPHGPAILAALPADRRPGQLRQRRWRPTRSDALHRGAAVSHH